MNFSPETSSSQEVIPKNFEHVDVPVETALAFQTMLMRNFFQSEDGSPFVCNDTTMWEWSSTYGKAFRVFCDTHPEIAKRINAGIVTPDEEHQLYLYEVAENNAVTQSELDEIVKYIKANPAQEVEGVLH